MCIRGSLFAGAVVVLIGCSDKGIEPPPPDAGYKMYVWGGSLSDYLYEYDFDTKRVDSFYLPVVSASFITASPDGKFLYLTSTTGKILDVTTKEIVGELGYPGLVVCSPDNRFIACLSYDLNILRASDYSLIYHDTTQVVQGSFTSDGQTFVGLGLHGVDGESHVYRLNMDSLANPERRVFSQAPLTGVVQSPDGSLWYLTMALGQFFYAFVVYDIARDRNLFWEYQIPGPGDVAPTPDGQFVFFFLPASMRMAPPRLPHPLNSASTKRPPIRCFL